MNTSSCDYNLFNILIKYGLFTNTKEQLKNILVEAYKYNGKLINF